MRMIRIMLDKLLPQLRSPNFTERQKARHLLADLGGQEVITALTTLGETADRQFRWEIVSTLAECSDDMAVPGLITAMYDEFEDIRLVAARGLSRHGSSGLTALATSLETTNHTEAFYQAAHHALHWYLRKASWRDRGRIKELMKAVTGPEPGISAPVAAFSFLHL